MNSQTINDVFAVIHVGLAAIAFVFAWRILLGDVVPGLGRLRHVFRRKPAGGVQIVLQQAEALAAARSADF